MKSAETSLDQIPVNIAVTPPVINDDNSNNNMPKKPKGWGRRHTVAILGFWGFAMAYAMRFNLAMAIVVMAKRSTLSLSPINAILDNSTLSPKDEVVDPSDIQSHGSQCPIEPSPVNSSHGNGTNGLETEGEFNWDEGDQGLVLGAFFWGYIVAQLPGAFISKRFGGKWPFGIGIFVTGFMTLLTPLATRMNIFMLVYVRVVQGFAQGMIFPSMQTMLAKWSPPNERSLFSAITYTGSEVGAAVMMISSGYLMESSGGWPSLFYFTGGLSILWFAFWIAFVFNTPDEHPSISEEERNYIKESLGEQVSEVSVPTPWKKILTSVPVWAIIIADFGHSWGFYILLMEMPTYLNVVLHFDITQDSWLSATPQLFVCVFANLIAFSADYCITKKWVRTITVRKVCHAIAEIGAAFAILGASFMECHRIAAVAFFTFAIGIGGSVLGSYVPNEVEIACNHAGIIMGITNTISNFAGLGTAVVVGAITKNNSTVESWRYVFFIAAICYIGNLVVYLAFASSDEQSWNREVPPGEPDLENRERQKETTKTKPFLLPTESTSKGLMGPK